MGNTESELVPSRPIVKAVESRDEANETRELVAAFLTIPACVTDVNSRLSSKHNPSALSVVRRKQSRDGMAQRRVVASIRPGLVPSQSVPTLLRPLLLPPHSPRVHFLRTVGLVACPPLGRTVVVGLGCGGSSRTAGGTGP